MNTTPLVWGMLHGQQRDSVELSLAPPAECAEQVANGLTEIGLVPVAEVARQGLEILPGLGISCLGRVRSILLFSRVPWPQVRTLSADANSRTSVQLAKVILRERFAIEPAVTSHKPNLDEMMQEAESALIIGDDALKIQPDQTGYTWLDLGDEWYKLTQLPMVFAVWAGKPGLASGGLGTLIRASYEFGRANLGQIIDSEYAKRGVTRELADEYLRRYIRFEIGRREERGLETFFELSGLVQGAKL